MMNNDTISRQAAIELMLAAIDDDWEPDYAKDRMCELPSAQPLSAWGGNPLHIDLPSAQPEIAEKLYLCKCYITDTYGLPHEVIHTGDIRRVTGWEI